MSESIRIALCDPSPLIRCGLRNIFSADPDIEISFEASSHAEILSNYDCIKMDVILVDIAEKGRSGVIFLRELRALLPELKVIVLNDCQNNNQLIQDRIIQCIELGVKGFQCKHLSTPEELIHAIHTVFWGGTNLSTGVMETLLSNMNTKQNILKGNLSTRERQVLEFLARGKSNYDIAETLCISIRTVKSHVSSILSKLNAKNRIEAALWLH